MYTRSLIQKIEIIFFFALILFLPTQLGKHFWPSFSIVQGLRVDYLAPTVYVTDVLLICLFVLWVTNKIVSGHLKFEIRNLSAGRQDWKFVVFLLSYLYLLLTIILSGNYGNGFYSLFKLLEYSFLVYYVATTLKTPRQIRGIAVSFAIATTFESLLAITQYFYQGSLNGIFYYFGERTFSADTPGIANASINGQLILRPYGTFSHPNVLAAYLLCSFILCAFLLRFFQRRTGKVILVLSLILGTLALFLTLSRIAIVVWVVVFVVILLSNLLQKSPQPPLTRGGILDFPFSEGEASRRFPPCERGVRGDLLGRKSSKLFVLVTALLVLLLFAVFFRPLILRFSQTSFNEESVVQREQLNQETAGLITSHMLFGVGLGNFLPVLANQNQLISLTFGLQPVHNIFLLVAAETGLIGFIICCWFLFQTYWHNWKEGVNAKDPSQRQIRFCFGLLLLVVLFTGMFDHYWLTLQQGQLLFSLIVGLCWMGIGYFR